MRQTTRRNLTIGNQFSSDMNWSDKINESSQIKHAKLINRLTRVNDDNQTQIHYKIGHIVHMLLNNAGANFLVV